MLSLDCSKKAHSERQPFPALPRAQVRMPHSRAPSPRPRPDDSIPGKVLQERKLRIRKDLETFLPLGISPFASGILCANLSRLGAVLQGGGRSSEELPSPTPQEEAERKPQGDSITTNETHLSARQLVTWGRAPGAFKSSLLFWKSSCPPRLCFHYCVPQKLQAVNSHWWSRQTKSQGCIITGSMSGSFLLSPK